MEQHQHQQQLQHRDGSHKQSCLGENSSSSSCSSSADEGHDAGIRVRIGGGRRPGSSSQAHASGDGCDLSAPTHGPFGGPWADLEVPSDVGSSSSSSSSEEDTIQSDAEQVDEACEDATADADYNCLRCDTAFPSTGTIGGSKDYWRLSRRAVAQPPRPQTMLMCCPVSSDHLEGEHCMNAPPPESPPRSVTRETSGGSHLGESSGARETSGASTNQTTTESSGGPEAPLGDTLVTTSAPENGNPDDPLGVPLPLPHFQKGAKATKAAEADAPVGAPLQSFVVAEDVANQTLPRQSSGGLLKQLSGTLRRSTSGVLGLSLIHI